MKLKFIAISTLLVALVLCGCISSADNSQSKNNSKSVNVTPSIEQKSANILSESWMTPTPPTVTPIPANQTPSSKATASNVISPGPSQRSSPDSASNPTINPTPNPTPNITPTPTIQPTPVPTASPPSGGNAYIGNSNTMKFHSSSCRYVSQIASDHVKNFASREQAIAAGYQPCKVCNP